MNQRIDPEGYRQYWIRHKNDHGASDYETSRVARLNDVDGNPLFPEMLASLVDRLDRNGCLQPRSSFVQHNVITSLTLLNTLVAHNAGNLYARQIESLVDCVVHDLSQLGTSRMSLVNFDLILSHELGLLHSSSIGLEASQRDSIKSVLEEYRTNARERFAGYETALEFSTANPQTIVSLECLPGEYVHIPYLQKHFERLGSIATNPAATARYYELTGDPRALRYLEDCAANSEGGQMMAIYPGPYFSISWVLGNLLKGRIDVRHDFANELDLLRCNITKDGIGASDGLPPDADDSAMVLHVLNLCKLECDHGAALLERWWNRTTQSYGTFYKANTHTPDVSVNVRILAAYLSDPRQPMDTKRRVWKNQLKFLERTSVDSGSSDNKKTHWSDRWNISPMYPTHEVVYVVSRYYLEYRDFYDTDLHHTAVEWILSRQGQDGGFMAAEEWGASLEETAYGLLALKWYLNQFPSPRAKSGRRFDALKSAIAKAERFLSAGSFESRHPPLWLAKSLYTPRNIIYAAITAALSLRVGSAPTGPTGTSERPSLAPRASAATKPARSAPRC